MRCWLGLACLVCAAPVFAEVLEWECNGDKNPRLTDQRIDEFENNVRAGAGLLIAFGEHPATDGLRLARLSPTTAWHTLQERASRGMPGPAAAGMRDEVFFLKPVTLALAYHWDVSPLRAVERGIGRYERFEQTAPYVGGVLPADNTAWTRPLENRDWRVRLWSDDPYRAPLLVTGRFGAGRVAVWGASLASLKTDTAAYEAVRAWLSGGESTTAAPALEVVATSRAADRTLRVTVRNRGSSGAKAEVVARFSTWERALVGDALATVDVPAGAVREVVLPFLKWDEASGYAALVESDEWWVRVGVVGGDGRLAAPELKVAADLRPPLRVNLAVDSLRTVKEYPFASMGPDSLFFRVRMGAPVVRYAYRPGETVTVTTTLAHSLANIAGQAVVRDETKPDNPTAMGLNDGAIQNEKGPRDGFIAWNAWTGEAARENRVTLTLPAPALLEAVALHLEPGVYRNLDDFNPAAVRVEVDGLEVAAANDLDARAVSDNGRVELALPPGTKGREVRLIFPWTASRTSRERARRGPTIGEVELLAVNDAAASAGALKGELVLRAREALTGESRELSRTAVTLAPGEQRTVATTLFLPAGVSQEGFWRIEAVWSGEVVRTLPVLSTRGEHALASLATLHPESAPGFGFIVTRGFRNIFDTGTGTQEMPNGWGNADDLVWAYSRKLKQTGSRARSVAGELYVNDSDFRHYSTPWLSFPNGEDFYETVTPLLVEKVKKDPRWADSDRVVFGHSDRWDTAPAMEGMFTWGNFMEFDAWLRAQGLAGLRGRTRSQLAKEITTEHDHRWQSWHLDRYLATLHRFRETFAADGKAFYIAAQGVPLVPPRAEAEVSRVIQGTSDDSTWGMDHENLPYTTGRQAGYLAFNPSYRMSTLLNWGWNSAVLNNWRWYSPVGTTEPSRRHYYDRAWRGVLDPMLGYRAMHAFGFGANGYASWTMTTHDWQEWWRLLERHALLTPDSPLGAGIVRSTVRFDAPETAIFGGGGIGTEKTELEIRRVSTLFQHLHEAGLGASFVGNAAQIARWPDNTPMVIVNPGEFSETETAALGRWLADGGRAVAFHDPSTGALSPEMAALFAGNTAGVLQGQPVKISARTLLIPVATENLKTSDFTAVREAMRAVLNPVLEFPAGTMGYGFRRGGLNYAVIEDWAERARTVELRINAGGREKRTLQALALNDHRSLAVRREGAVWIITVPLRPGDGEVVVWKETEEKP